MIVLRSGIVSAAGGPAPTSSPGLATHAAAESAAATLPHGLGLADPAANRAFAHAPWRMLAWDRSALFDPSTRPRPDLSRVLKSAPRSAYGY